MNTTAEKLAEALRVYLADLTDNGAGFPGPLRAALAAYDAERAAREPAGSHACEPWQVITEINSGRALQIWCADEWEICEMSRGDDSARRIVACVNACAGIPTETLEAMNAREAGLLRSAVRLVVKLEGGIVHWIGSDGRVPVEVAVIDYDTEGAGDDECAEIPQDGGGTARAVARIETADDSDPEWIAHAFDAIKAADFIEEWQTRPEPEGGDE